VYTHQDGDLGFYTEVQKLNPEQKRKLAALVANSNVDQIAQALDRTVGYPFVVGGLAFRHIRGEVNHTFSDLASLAKQVFRHRITYMGPIRLTPKVNYDPSSGRPDVGPSGEFTAYVLHAMGDQTFFLPLPDGSRERVSLNQAVNLWLEFFGLARGAKTTDNGRLGIGLRLKLLNGGNEVDLTSVGVGVSQVLPVIVSCLVARKGTVLLLEQPELHLHPKLQMDLADFLIACCKSGRQIIVETHSEHIVSRIRRRIAESTDSELEDLVGILFAEQRNGVTEYRSPSINKFGGLGSDWPDGFLDVGAGEMENLLGAGLAKRKKK
jgi:predicted ATPase